ncbi:MAG: adenosylmethionine--8-amino-7-oxononanoate transaminase [Gammaproteobacteria bacterium]|jgi:adenosylmethionine-8-amino-7-oxononanoate aminotransferase|nr:adenosylmethionine--8-amino-7-oxononanoate transaminase [Gammaproteobacteria bacterium]MBT3725518.1 adenosylmethionine--8-amino-7-oxononanoate transaminase [Gammaproteobacteria bacterium]MBT4076307.1 adenosylmethionine--8-amino-7-oxononanoate transaminase [Gammaproteobacteria bacterium]MBT4194677.1 adenosylmethionine--8-amino-7-oxononanoate transaminase [Gammaproteobacteria bacterium]MBT4452322.1 adenosylmethionine--8-amino-7-oxononanoate transaminase [Gammaproteobacteria bacterium]
MNKQAEWVNYDKDYVWHPYSSMNSEVPVFPVSSASGVTITLQDGRKLIDGMSSWWCALHGYNHPVLNKAVTDQLQDMSHIMFGGLTHEPAAQLAATLVEITPEPLQTVFFSDSGSVSVEAAMKMAIQYWGALGLSKRQRFVSLRSGYHGDTFAAMSVCDPVTGMHSLFSETLTQQFFVESPQCLFNEACDEHDLAPLRKTLEQHQQQIAAVILEPIVQGAGGMHFYSPEFLVKARQLCDEFNVLLIADEIATGFGRTGKLFACEFANISPDIMCVGKSLTGGYMTLAATLTTDKISQVISQNPPGVFMHGPTFMANPLACAVANASIKLLLDSDWKSRVTKIESGLKSGLLVLADLPIVQNVRVLGAIGVVELKQAVDMKTIQPAFVDQGVWVRPFGKLVYLMPPFIISDIDLKKLTDAVRAVVSSL